MITVRIYCVWLQLQFRRQQRGCQGCLRLGFELCPLISIIIHMYNGLGQNPEGSESVRDHEFAKFAAILHS